MDLNLLIYTNVYVSQVSVLAPNVPAMYEMHFAVPMSGAVLNTINTRLDAANVATILRHCEPKLFFVDYQYVRLASHALNLLGAENRHCLPLIVIIDDIDTPTGTRLGELEYETLIQSGNPNDPPADMADEWDPITLNYTSGTTSAPKGVVYSHRGAYLSTLTLLLQWGVKNEPVYLWTLPMFHCNGWTFTWGVAARGGTNVCIRSPSALDIHNAISNHRVTHMCCAPVIFKFLLEAQHGKIPSSPVSVLTGGAPPPAAVLQQVERLGFCVTQAYGLTEATGPALVCEWQAEWDGLPARDRAQMKARQGVSVLTLVDADVMDTETMTRVRRDGKSLGEIVLRGSSIMKGYYKNPIAMAETFKNGWFLTGDVGVVHPDGYIEIKDRKKDVIISGGENISSVEVESVIYQHPAVEETAVVAMPHKLWGETRCAFVAVKKGCEVSEEEFVLHCRSKMAKFMVPKRVVFMGELPKTAKGSVQKFELRELARELAGVGAVSGKGHARVSDGSNGTGKGHVAEYGEGELVAMSRL